MLDIRLGNLATRKQASHSRHPQQILILPGQPGHVKPSVSLETSSRPGNVKTSTSLERSAEFWSPRDAASALPVPRSVVNYAASAIPRP
eukprot:1321885-Pyramimonas_sp.AAC.1